MRGDDAARKELRTKTKTMFEFCCSSKSSLGAVNADRGIDHFRLSLDMTDLTDPKEVESLKQLVKQFPGCTLWGHCLVIHGLVGRVSISQSMGNLLPRN